MQIPQHTFSDTEKKRWIDNILRIYTDMNKKSAQGDYRIECHSNEKTFPLIISKSVYSPEYFTDSFWFAEELPKVVNTKSLLEIGTGTGIIGISCALNGSSKVVLTDINPKAVYNATLNVKLNNLNLEVRRGSIYSPIQKNEKFDYIFWSHPYNNWPKPVSNMLLKSGFDYRYIGLKEYINNAKHHLTQHGRLLLGTGNTADIETIIQCATDNNYTIDILKKAEIKYDLKDVKQITNMILQFNPA